MTRANVSLENTYSNNFDRIHGGSTAWRNGMYGRKACGEKLLGSAAGRKAGLRRYCCGRWFRRDAVLGRPGRRRREPSCCAGQPASGWRWQSADFCAGQKPPDRSWFRSPEEWPCSAFSAALRRRATYSGRTGTISFMAVFSSFFSPFVPPPACRRSPPPGAGERLRR